jgi:P27 family predicted phage terminase small subunit
MNAAEPHPAGTGATPPAWLHGKARQHWRRIQPMVAGMGVHTDADIDALALYCDALAEYVEAREVVRVGGFTVTVYDDEGRVVSTRTRTEVKVYQDAWRRANLMLQQFGLSPASRAKVGGGKPADEDPFEAFLGKKA